MERGGSRRSFGDLVSIDGMIPLLVSQCSVSLRSQVVSVDLVVWVAGRSEWECAGSCLECDEVRR